MAKVAASTFGPPTQTKNTMTDIKIKQAKNRLDTLILKPLIVIGLSAGDDALVCMPRSLAADGVIICFVVTLVFHNRAGSGGLLVSFISQIEVFGRAFE